MKIKLDKLEIYLIDSNIRKTINDEFHINNYNNFPVLLNPDNSVWKHGSLFLLNKLKNYEPINSKRLNDLAVDLQQFRDWTISEDIDYINITRKLLVPTYLYKKYLINILVGKVKNDNMKITSPNTIKRKIGTIISFYRYLKDIENIKFKFSLWEDSIANISYKDYKGFEQNKQVFTTDLSKNIAQVSPSTTEENTIIDGRKLHPLDTNEQIYLFKVLNVIGHTEMKLAFLITIATGARIQTVFTLRQKHFEKTYTDYQKEVVITVGAGTDCDTKFDKVYDLIFPLFLYEKIKIYLNSPRYKKRLNKAKCIYEDNSKQYIFLSTHGNPFYISKYDPYREDYKKQPEGDAIRMFIKDRLNVKIKELGYKIRPFSFHDLRASFGMNLIDILNDKVNKGELSSSQILIRVKNRMGHSNIETTQRYLDFRENNEAKETIQNEYENYLMVLANER